MKSRKKFAKHIVLLLVVLLFTSQNFASIVSSSDGDTFVTKGEFDTLQREFNQQIDYYNRSLDNKITGAIAEYLSGIGVAEFDSSNTLLKKLADDSGNIYSKKTTDFIYQKGYPDFSIYYYFYDWGYNVNKKSKIGKMNWVYDATKNPDNTYKRNCISVNNPGEDGESYEWQYYATDLKEKLEGRSMYLSYQYAGDPEGKTDYTYSSKYFPLYFYNDEIINNPEQPIPFLLDYKNFRTNVCEINNVYDFLTQDKYKPYESNYGFGTITVTDLKQNYNSVLIYDYDEDADAYFWDVDSSNEKVVADDDFSNDTLEKLYDNANISQETADETKEVDNEYYDVIIESGDANTQSINFSYEQKDSSASHNYEPLGEAQYVKSYNSMSGKGVDVDRYVYSYWDDTTWTQVENPDFPPDEIASINWHGEKNGMVADVILVPNMGMAGPNTGSLENYAWLLRPSSDMGADPELPGFHSQWELNLDWIRDTYNNYKNEWDDYISNPGGWRPWWADGVDDADVTTAFIVGKVYNEQWRRVDTWYDDWLGTDITMINYNGLASIPGNYAQCDPYWDPSTGMPDGDWDGTEARRLLVEDPIGFQTLTGRPYQYDYFYIHVKGQMNASDPDTVFDWEISQTNPNGFATLNEGDNHVNYAPYDVKVTLNFGKDMTPAQKASYREKLDHLLSDYEYSGSTDTIKTAFDTFYDESISTWGMNFLDMDVDTCKGKDPYQNLIAALDDILDDNFPECYSVEYSADVTINKATDQVIEIDDEIVHADKIGIFSMPIIVSGKWNWISNDTTLRAAEAQKVSDFVSGVYDVLLQLYQGGSSVKSTYESAIADLIDDAAFDEDVIKDLSILTTGQYQGGGLLSSEVGNFYVPDKEHLPFEFSFSWAWSDYGETQDETYKANIERLVYDCVYDHFDDIRKICSGEIAESQYVDTFSGFFSGSDLDTLKAAVKDVMIVKIVSDDSYDGNPIDRMAEVPISGDVNTMFAFTMKTRQHFQGPVEEWGSMTWKDERCRVDDGWTLENYQEKHQEFLDEQRNNVSPHIDDIVQFVKDYKDNQTIDAKNALFDYVQQIYESNGMWDSPNTSTWDIEKKILGIAFDMSWYETDNGVTTKKTETIYRYTRVNMNNPGDDRMNGNVLSGDVRMIAWENEPYEGNRRTYWRGRFEKAYDWDQLKEVAEFQGQHFPSVYAPTTAYYEPHYAEMSPNSEDYKIKWKSIQQRDHTQYTDMYGSPVSAYNLMEGLPLVNAKAGFEYTWTPTFNVETGCTPSSSTPEITLNVGPYTPDGETVDFITNVDGSITFTVDRPMTVFVRWENDFVLDASANNTILSKVIE